jgi:hypothetical protein
MASGRVATYPVCTGDVNPDLTDSGSDGLHRLPVVRIQAVLDAPQPETSQPPCERRERPKVTSPAAEPDERFVRHRSRPLSIQVFVWSVS